MHEIIKSQDYDRYIASLFTPLNYREDIFTVISFNFEVQKILKVVSDPMIGMIRFAWWREGIEEAFNVEKPVRNHQILQNIRRLKVNFDISPEHFYTIIDGYEKLLENENFKTLNDFRHHINCTNVALTKIMCEVIGVTDRNILEASEKFACAYGVITEIRSAMLNFPNNKFNLPEDVFSNSGAPFESYGKQTFLESSKEAIGKMIFMARQEMLDGRVLLEKIELKTKQKAACVLLMAKVTDFYADYIEANDFDVFSKPIFNELNSIQVIKLSLANFFGKY